METKEKVFLEKYACAARMVSLKLEEKEEIRSRLVAEIKAGPVKVFSPEDIREGLFDKFGQAMRRLVAGI